MSLLNTVETWIGPYRKSAVLNSLILAVVGLVAYAMLMSSRGNGIGVFIAVLLAVPGLLGLWSASPIFVMIFTTYLLFDPGFSAVFSFLSVGSYRIFPNRVSFNLETVLLAASFLAYLMGHYRLYSFLNLVTPKEPFPRRFTNDTSPHARPPESVATDELLRALVGAGACLVVGTILWFVLDFWGDYLRKQYLLSASEYRVLILLFALLGGTGIVWGIVTAWRWYKLTPQEARLALRDVHYHELHSDIYRIRFWQRSKKR